MPRYEVRLESPDRFRDDGSPHYRLTRLVADDAEAARAICEAQERKLTDYEMPGDELARVVKDHRLDEDALAEGAVVGDPGKPLKGTDRGRLFAHLQAAPYEVVSVTEIAGPRDGEG